jgi:hypothetical protein
LFLFVLGVDHKGVYANLLILETEIIMSRPSWMKSDQDSAREMKERVLARIVGLKESDVSDDLDREEGFQQLMEDNGRSY